MQWCKIVYNISLWPLWSYYPFLRELKTSGDPARDYLADFERIRRENQSRPRDSPPSRKSDGSQNPLLSDFQRIKRDYESKERRNRNEGEERDRYGTGRDSGKSTTAWSASNPVSLGNDSSDPLHQPIDSLLGKGSRRDIDREPSQNFINKQARRSPTPSGLTPTGKL